MFILLFILISLGLAVKTNIMLPLNTVNNSCVLNKTICSYFPKMKEAGVFGVMVDVWWGICEPNPKAYNFNGYVELARECANAGLKLQCVMSFHRCGGNVGDDCNIPIPSWARNSRPFYQDIHGNLDEEVVSLAYDDFNVLDGRTPLQVYHDFMKAFDSAMRGYIGSTVSEVQVGMGPAGELRYPGYQSSLWNYPGIGEFQCFDRELMAQFAKAATQAGHPEWTSPPTDAGSYNSTPYDSLFFKDGYKSDYGKFFLNWYSNLLINHGEKVLQQAKNVFGNSLDIAAKVAGIHWWYAHDSHAAESTTGYYNPSNRSSPDSFYRKAAIMISKYNAILDFTCFEMSDDDNPSEYSFYGSRPEELVSQVVEAVKLSGRNGRIAAENALPRYDDKAYSRMIDNACNKGKKAVAVTYLRLNRDLIDNNDNWNRFISLVKRLNECG